MGAASGPEVDDIDAVLNKAMHGVDTRSVYPGMSYEDGVIAAIEWMQGTGDCPFEDLELSD